MAKKNMGLMQNRYDNMKEATTNSESFSMDMNIHMPTIISRPTHEDQVHPYFNFDVLTKQINNYIGDMTKRYF